MPALEVTPLLADPPIDDDSYRYEAQSFPNAEQKHEIYVAYLTTTLLSRYCEIAGTLILALTFQRSLLPVTFYSFTVLAVSAWYDRITMAISRPFTSRLGLLATIVVQQRAAMIAFFALIVRAWRRPDAGAVERAVLVVGLAAAMSWLKAALAVFQATFRWEWLRILANNQQGVRMLFETGIHGMSTVSQLVFPVVAGVLAQSLSPEQWCLLSIFGAALGLLVELSLVYKLYSSCYALHLGRTPYTSTTAERSLEEAAMIGVLTTPLTAAAHGPASAQGLVPFSSRPLSRIIQYIKRKPVPVLATVGSVLANISLVTIGPHVVWYMLGKRVSPIALGMLKMLQTLVTLRPVVLGGRSFVIGAAGTLLGLVALAFASYSAAHTKAWVLLFGFAIVLARSGVPGITLISEQFVADYFADEEVLKLYKEGADLLQIESELFIHLLTIVWPYAHQFLWPITVSAFFSLAGMLIIEFVLLRYRRAAPAASV